MECIVIMLRKIKSKLCDKKNEFCVFYNDMDNNRDKLFDFAETFLAILGKKSICKIQHEIYQLELFRIQHFQSIMAFNKD